MRKKISSFYKSTGDISIQVIRDCRKVSYPQGCIDKSEKEKVRDNYVAPVRIKITLKNTQSYSPIYMETGYAKNKKDFERIENASGIGQKKQIGNERPVDIHNKISNQVDAYVDKLLKVPNNPTLEQVELAIKGCTDKMSFLQLWMEHINSSKKKTGECYHHAYRHFVKCTKFTEKDGFNISYGLINKWVDIMNKGTGEIKPIAPSSQGIYLRAFRVILNKAIDRGYLTREQYFFTKRSKNNIPIPIGERRDEQHLEKSQMDYLFNLWLHHHKDDEALYEGLGFFLVQYLCNGCNMIDLAHLTYNDYYWKKKSQAFRFIRHKTENTSTQGGIEVIIPITKPLGLLLDIYAQKPNQTTKSQKVFPQILLNAKTEEQQSSRVHDYNGKINGKLKELLVKDIWDYEVIPTNTYARHSFATILGREEKVPEKYVKQAMGHSTQSRGDITEQYQDLFTIDDRMKFNNYLLEFSTPQSTKIDKALNQAIDGLSKEKKLEIYKLIQEAKYEELAKG